MKCHFANSGYSNYYYFQKAILDYIYKMKIPYAKRWLMNLKPSLELKNNSI